MADCGTYAGYQVHRMAKQDACGPCKAAANAYQAAYRKRNPQSVVRRLAAQEARRRALRRLAKRHPGEFRALYDEEKSRS